jgi:hypothetical protein
MMTVLLIVILIVVIADAVTSRRSLRTRATQRARKPQHHLVSGARAGWHRIQDLEERQAEREDPSVEAFFSSLKGRGR